MAQEMLSSAAFPNADSDRGTIDLIRSQVVAAANDGLSIVVVPSLALYVYHSLDAGWHTVNFVGVGLYLIIWISTLLCKRFSLNVQASILFSSIMPLVVVGLLSFGLIGPVGYYLA